jgi:hypothetical protein
MAASTSLTSPPGPPDFFPRPAPNWAQGDADHDHDVDGADFLIWERQYDPGPTSRTVPEPPTALAAVFGLLALSVGCRQK